MTKSTEKWCKDTFFHPALLFPCNFCEHNSSGICTAVTVLGSASIVIPSVNEQLLRNQPGIGRGNLACLLVWKITKGIQTSFAELPNTTMRQRQEHFSTAVTLVAHFILWATFNCEVRLSGYKRQYHLLRNCMILDGNFRKGHVLEFFLYIFYYSDGMFG